MEPLAKGPKTKACLRAAASGLRARGRRLTEEGSGGAASLASYRPKYNYQDHHSGYTLKHVCACYFIICMHVYVCRYSGAIFLLNLDDQLALEVQLDSPQPRL